LEKRIIGLAFIEGAFLINKAFIEDFEALVDKFIVEDFNKFIEEDFVAFLADKFIMAFIEDFTVAFLVYMFIIEVEFLGNKSIREFIRNKFLGSLVIQLLMILLINIMASLDHYLV